VNVFGFVWPETIDIILKLAPTVSSCGDFHFVPSQTLVVNLFLRIYAICYVMRSFSERTGDIYGLYVCAVRMGIIIDARTGRLHQP